MLSESARMSSAAEARFRIPTQAPTARAIAVFPLDSATERELSTFVQDIPSADLVVMVASAGTDAKASAVIGRACSDARIMTTTIVIRGESTTDEALARTLAQVRPWSLMVVVASDGLYVDDIIRSFR